MEDLLVDNHTWVITQLIFATGHWWDGRRVLVSARTIKEDVSWPEATVSVDLTRRPLKTPLRTTRSHNSNASKKECPRATVVFGI